MTVRELIELLENNSFGQAEDTEIEFLSYEWDDDLESLSYQERTFEGVANEGNKLQILISR